MRFSRTTTTLPKMKKFGLLILSQLHCFDKGLEAQLTYAFVLVIIPQENFVHWELWMRATTNKCQNVASEKHFDYSYASIEF